MRASFFSHYPSIGDPADLDWDEMNALLWELPAESAAMRAFRLLLEGEGDGDLSVPEQGPQTMEQVRNYWNQVRSAKRRQPPPRYLPWRSLEDGPMMNDPRLRRTSPIAPTPAPSDVVEF